MLRVGLTRRDIPAIRMELTSCNQGHTSTTPPATAMYVVTLDTSYAEYNNYIDYLLEYI